MSLQSSQFAAQGAFSPLCGTGGLSSPGSFPCSFLHSPGTHPGPVSILFLSMPVCAFLHLQPAALSQFETCHPISIIIKALHFPTKQGIGFPCLRYLSISALCTCPVPLSALWDVSISLLADLRSVKLNLAKLLQCQQRYQGTDWAFHKHPWQPPAEASWLFLWQNAVGFMGKAVAWH